MENRCDNILPETRFDFSTRRYLSRRHIPSQVIAINWHTRVILGHSSVERNFIIASRGCPREGRLGQIRGNATGKLINPITDKQLFDPIPTRCHQPRPFAATTDPMGFNGIYRPSDVAPSYETIIFGLLSRHGVHDQSYLTR